MNAAIRQLLSLVLVLLVSSPRGATVVVASRQQHNGSNKGIRADFVRAMNEATQKKEETKRQASLMKRMLKSARLVKNAFVTNHPDQQRRHRKLDNNNMYQYENQNWNYGYNNYYQQDDAYQQQEQQGQDADNVWAQDYGGLNLTQYALKYVGCQNIHTFSDEMAANGDGTLAMNRFVVFRLCPKSTCSNYNDFGCDYNYGEYTIPMEDYLITMNEYHIQQYQEYCQTCHYCMTGTGDFAQNNNDRRKLDYNGGGQYYYYNKNGNYYQNNYQNQNQYQNNNNYNNDDGGAANNGDDYYGAGDDDGKYANKNYNNNDDGGNDAYNNGNNYNAYDDAVAANGDDDAAAANGDDDAAAANGDDDAAAAAASNYQCMYADVCAAYKDACASEMFTDGNFNDYSDNYAAYFECAEFDVGGSVSYLGPHCRSDGFTIGIGIYEDQYCSSYVGDMLDMEEVTGQEYKDDYLEPYYPTQCISCSATESYALEVDQDMNNDNEEENLYEVCGYLYQQAAKCNRYLGDENTYYGQYEQEANENDVCNFVASLVENNYDEYGEAYLESPEWELAKWKELNSYRQDMAERASPHQILALIASIGLVVVLFFYIIYLRYKLSRRVPWKPGMGTSKEAGQAGQLSRVGSGITMQRSLSGLEPGYSGSGSYA